MPQIDKTNEGRPVELIHTNDRYTKLKPGDKGTYQMLMRHGQPMQDQHCIEWDSGSTLMLLEGVDSFKFLKDTIKCPKCRNREEFYRSFKAFERIWPDGEGGYGFKDGETIEVYEIQCRKCMHSGKPEDFKY